MAPGALSALLRELVAPSEVVESGAAFHPGQIVGRFELLREIGRGGFGIVFEARDGELGRLVAFKAVRHARALGAREERLLREAEAAARLSHPNIVTLYDVGRSEAGPYLVLELLRGAPLQKPLERGALPARDALRITLEAARGLAHAHAQGVVHRDLTPNNVFLCDDGQVKVLDFGMAHAFGHRKLEGGTRRYMAPEQARGAPEDERTDVFALGVLLFQMLTGRLPSRGDEPGRRRAKGTLDIAEAPGLGALASRMMSDDPVGRPRTAGVVVPLLESLAGDVRTPGRSKARPRARARLPTVARPAREPSVAVLPFVDMSPGGDHEYFSAGVAEEIVNALVHVNGLRVAGRASTHHFKTRGAKLADIGRELEVSTVLEGSVRTEGRRVRVSAQLVTAADGTHLWSEVYDREMTSIFAVQDEIAAAVAHALELNLLASRRAPTGYATSSVEAYNEYLLGRQFRRQGYAESNLAEATERFQRAIALDPAYAPAWAGLAEAVYFLADFAGSSVAVLELQSRAASAAEKAVVLGPAIPDGYSQRGRVRATVSWDWAGAEADLAKARALSPTDAWSQRNYGVLLSYLGRLPESVKVLLEAIGLDPLDARAWGTLGAHHLATGDLAQARSAFERARQIVPEDANTSFNLGLTSLLEGDPAAALALFEANPIGFNRLLGVALARHACGDVAGAREAREAFIARFAHAHAYEVAQACAWSGDRELAFEWLRRAADVHDRNLPDVKIDPLLRCIRTDGRYRGLLRRMNLPVD